MPQFETERLLLRRWSVEDIDDFHRLMSQPSCIVGGWKPSASREESLATLKSHAGDDGVFAICLREGGRAVDFVKIYEDNNRGR